MRALVTGAAGFVGSHCCTYFEAQGLEVRRLVRTLPRNLPKTLAGQDWVATGDLGNPQASPSLEQHLQDVDVVVHVAGRAHVLREHAAQPQQEFERANVIATERLAEASLRTGVRRFVFVSSIGVLGRARTYPLTEVDTPQPDEPYAHSKLRAEQRLAALSADSRMQAVVVRPTLIYGAHCPGNMARLIRLVQRGWPLPLGDFHRPRSLLGIENFCVLLHLLATHPAAAGETFVAADTEDLSLVQILTALAQGLQKPLRLLPIPEAWVSALARMLGARAQDAVQKLAHPLRVDASKARRLLGWTSVQSTTAGLSAAAASFRSSLS